MVRSVSKKDIKKFEELNKAKDSIFISDNNPSSRILNDLLSKSTNLAKNLEGYGDLTRAHILYENVIKLCDDYAESYIKKNNGVSPLSDKNWDLVNDGYQRTRERMYESISPGNLFGTLLIMSGIFFFAGNITGNVIGTTNVSYIGGTLFLIGLALLCVGFYKKR